MNLDRVTFALLSALAGRDGTQRLLNVALHPFNPFDPRRHGNPYPLYEQARTRGPVFYHRPIRTWLVTGHEEATEVLRGPVSVDRRPLVEALSQYRRMRPDNVELLLSTMLMLDPPHHGRLRNLVNRAFTRRAVADMAPRIAALTDELVQGLIPTAPVAPATPNAGEPVDMAPAPGEPVDMAPAPGEPVDLMAGLADRLPIYTISKLLGVPRANWDELKQLFDVVTKFVEPFTGFDPAEMDRALDRLRSLIGSLADQRTRRPADDLLTALVQAEDDGDRLTRTELTSMVIVLLIGGHETTSGAIGNSLLALNRHPDAIELLRARPDLIDDAVEELLRYDSSIQATDRTALEDFTVGGRTIRKGEVILVLLGAANRDPRRYPDPARLDFDRRQTRSISFGHGIHHCVGAALARMELASVLSAFVNTFPRYRIGPDGPTWRRSMTFRGPSTLPILLGPVQERLPTPAGSLMTAATEPSTISPPMS